MYRRWPKVCLRFFPLQAFEGLDREGKGFLTAEGIKQVVGVDFDHEEVRPRRHMFGRVNTVPAASCRCSSLLGQKSKRCRPASACFAVCGARLLAVVLPDPLHLAVFQFKLSFHVAASNV